MQNNKYSGTLGLTFDLAINRIFELMDKQPLGKTDEEFYNEAKSLIENEIKSLIKGREKWDKVKGSLTAKQLLKILEEE